MLGNGSERQNSEIESCEQPIVEKEIIEALKQLHNGKTPGTDGLLQDSYKLFWIYIKTLLIESLLYAIETGEMSIERKRVIITPCKFSYYNYISIWPYYIVIHF